MNHAEEYRAIFDSRSAEEIRTLARIKRFMERVMGDDQFRDKLKANVEDPGVVAEEYGIDVDPKQMLPLWRNGYTHLRFDKGTQEYPLAMMWDSYISEMLKHRDSLRTHGSTQESHPEFNAWRERQIHRTTGECGASGGSITHPVVAFELSEGCSVGCWFCGISADKYKGSLAYTEQTGDMWRGILQVVTDRFGYAAQSGFCYWATDPMDNPDYPDFIEDYYRVTGYLPQTTTAAPLKNVENTRRVLALFKKYRCIVNRFSILSRKMLDKVHQEFSADELMNVELVLQNKESLLVKAPAGRALERRKKRLAQGKDGRLSIAQGDHVTIACVTGFLVNMVTKTIRMVTPTRPSERWPDGYKVLGTRTFDSAESFEREFDALIRTHTDPEIPADRPIRLRPDIEYKRDGDGFTVTTKTKEHGCTLYPFSGVLGDLIASGKETYGTALEKVVEEGGDVLLANRLIHALNDLGLLLEGVDLEQPPGLVPADKLRASPTPSVAHP